MHVFWFIFTFYILLIAINFIFMFNISNRGSQNRLARASIFIGPDLHLINNNTFFDGIQRLTLISKGLKQKEYTEQLSRIDLCCGSINFGREGMGIRKNFRSKRPSLEELLRSSVQNLVTATAHRWSISIELRMAVFRLAQQPYDCITNNKEWVDRDIEQVFLSIDAGHKDLKEYDLAKIIIAKRKSRHNLPKPMISRIASVVAEIGEACEKWGAFQVIYPGLPLELHAKFELAMKKFFAQPPEEKRKLRKDIGGVKPYDYGYEEFAKNLGVKYN
ncbi:hypothetical protein RJ640_005844 [Escallonia rubra]|uniref:Non-haem dioxygenase N-terminal domain-containing protein n=1 Tax=Escallonia rubra TaxID=112253 RepID=A0AA88RJR9_9ASTE|nr:hypothetical protein RJ640_005844 [Escallonia rubra]